VWLMQPKALATTCTTVSAGAFEIALVIDGALEDFWIFLDSCSGFFFTFY